MRKLQNHLIGIVQGTKVLFSDYEDGGEMWTGDGPRERRIRVRFKTPFKTIPAITVSLDMWDMDQKTNQRADISATSITENGFTIVFKTWGDTKVARVRAAWMAIGEATFDDEWTLY